PGQRTENAARIQPQKPAVAPQWMMNSYLDPNLQDPISCVDTLFMRIRPARFRLPLWLRSNGLVDLPKIAFGIGKVRRAQPPALVGWRSDKRDALRFEFLICGIDIRNTSSQKP